MKNAVVKRISNILPPPPTHTQKKRVHCGGSSELVMRMKIDTRNKTRKRYQQTKLHFFSSLYLGFLFFLFPISYRMHPILEEMNSSSTHRSPLNQVDKGTVQQKKFAQTLQYTSAAI